MRPSSSSDTGGSRVRGRRLRWITVIAAAIVAAAVSYTVVANGSSSADAERITGISNSGTSYALQARLEDTREVCLRLRLREPDESMAVFRECMTPTRDGIHGRIRYDCSTGSVSVFGAISGAPDSVRSVPPNADGLRSLPLSDTASAFLLQTVHQSLPLRLVAGAEGHERRSKLLRVSKRPCSQPPLRERTTILKSF
jgi:hypothetical protein